MKVLGDMWCFIEIYFYITQTQFIPKLLCTGIWNCKKSLLIILERQSHELQCWLSLLIYSKLEFWSTSLWRHSICQYFCAGETLLSSGTLYVSADFNLKSPIVSVAISNAITSTGSSVLISGLTSKKACHCNQHSLWVLLLWYL